MRSDIKNSLFNGHFRLIRTKKELILVTKISSFYMSCLKLDARITATLQSLVALRSYTDCIRIVAQSRIKSQILLIPNLLEVL